MRILVHYQVTLAKMAAGGTGPIRKLLIANRGEIACRIMRTAKQMNIQTLAIFSAADEEAMHVRKADEAHYVGFAEPQKSYLNQDRIFEIAHENRVSAIHPGYGFLSENSEFAQRCQEEKLIFVGPSASSIRTMGIKNESKRIMIEAGVPVVPGYHGDEQDDELLIEEARKIGYPVLIKPVRGGGGKGMRVVHREEDFLESLESSRRESLKSFNDQSMLLEKFIVKPRHVEVQVFGDTFGNHVYLFERDCSIQRRHQKIIEEAPAPLLSEEKRRDLGRKAVAAAKAVDYVGAGTVEFILDKQTGEFYFMEMNTRLQVEHPITEMITGTDLVEWQLRVASGEPLPKSQSDIAICGHAFEARIYAEDPDENFLPQTGRLNYMCLPDNTQTNGCSLDKRSVRLDTGVASGDVISPYYDPMIAKLVVWDKDRQTALEKLRVSLEQYVVVGVPTNIKFLAKLASNKSFEEADVGTDFIELNYDQLFCDQPKELPLPLAEISAAVYKLLSELQSPLNKDLTSFRILSHKAPTYSFSLSVDAMKCPVKVDYTSLSFGTGNLSVTFGETNMKTALSARVEGDQVSVKLNNGIHKFKSVSPILTDEDAHESLVVLRNGRGENCLVRFKFDPIFQKAQSTSSSANANPLLATAPMPGIIEKVLVSEGDLVAEGQSLVILSAMKMEYSIKSNIEGQVAAIKHKPGEFVAKESVLVRLEARK